MCSQTGGKPRAGTGRRLAVRIVPDPAHRKEVARRISTSTQLGNAAGKRAMQHSRSTLGPRGWAILTLVAGAGLASPFLRPPQVELAEQISESTLGLSSAPGRLAAVRLAVDSLPPHALPGTSSPTSTERGSTNSWGSQSQIPEWAQPTSPIDQLISQGAAPRWDQTAVSESPRLAPLQPWGTPTAVAPLPSQTIAKSADQQLSALPQPTHPLRPTITSNSLGTSNSAPAPTSPAAVSQLVVQQQIVQQAAPAQAVAPRAFVFQPGFPDRQQPAPKVTMRPAQ